MNDAGMRTDEAGLDANEQLLQFYEMVVQQQAQQVNELRRNLVAPPATTGATHVVLDDPRYIALRSELSMVYESETWRVGQRICRIARSLHLSEVGVRLIRLLSRP